MVVLLVDATPSTARLLTLAFSEFGAPVDVRIATSERKAAATLARGDDAAERAPDVVVLDVDDLATGGRDLLCELRGSESNGSLPVVVFSRNDDPAVVTDYRDLGATAYLVKPGNYEELRDVVEVTETLVETRGLEQASTVEVE